MARKCTVCGELFEYPQEDYESEEDDMCYSCQFEYWPEEEVMEPSWQSRPTGPGLWLMWYPEGDTEGFYAVRVSESEFSEDRLFVGIPCVYGPIPESPKELRQSNQVEKAES